jgi:hypothetical protein
VRDNHIGLSESGHRVGETHPRSRYSDVLVERIRDMHEYDGMTYRAISNKLNIPICTIGKLCRYERRAVRVVKWVKKI